MAKKQTHHQFIQHPMLRSRYTPQMLLGTTSHSCARCGASLSSLFLLQHQFPSDRPSTLEKSWNSVHFSQPPPHQLSLHPLTNPGQHILIGHSLSPNRSNSHVHLPIHFPLSPQTHLLLSLLLFVLGPSPNSQLSALFHISVSKTFL